jgi:hypothetical protein
MAPSLRLQQRLLLRLAVSPQLPLWLLLLLGSLAATARM